MKILVSLFLLLVAFSSYAEEINLMCKGTEKQQQNNLPPEIVQRIYEITFDDKVNEVKSFTRRLSQGCLQRDDSLLPVKCECKVTANEIGCDSEVVGIKNQEWKSQDSFRVNRATGRMTTYITSGTIKNKFNFIGELNCEKFIKNKF